MDKWALILSLQWKGASGGGVDKQLPLSGERYKENPLTTLRKRLVDAYDVLSTQPLLPFPKMDNDPIHETIDAAVSEALSLPDLSVMQNLLAQEPVVCLRALS